MSAGQLREAVCAIYQERRHLAATLRDTKSVIGKLERVLGCMVHVVFVFFYLFIFNVDVTKAWLVRACTWGAAEGSGWCVNGAAAAVAALEMHLSNSAPPPPNARPQSFSSIILAFVFVFGNSLKTVFECVVWLFVVHPFDGEGG